MNLLDTASLVVTPNGYKASKLYSIVPSDGSGDMTFARTGDTATRVNSSGLIETVLANKPRLDYTSSTCPKLLLEPQRTNLALYSEQFDISSFWGTLATATITANAIASPSGSVNADKVIENTANSSHLVYGQSVTSTANTSYTVSLYLKAGERYQGFIRISGINIGDDGFNLNTGSCYYGTLTSVGNGWFRYVRTYSSSTTITGSYVAVILRNSAGSDVYTGDGTSGMYLWGAQWEQGAYATSYIPTTTASVTRNADSCSKTGISSLIGQTQGTLYADFQHDGFTEENWLISVQTNTSTFIAMFVLPNGTPYFYILDGGALQLAYTGTVLSVGRHKMSIGYKQNNFACYIDGTLRYSSTTGNVPTCSGMNLGNFIDGAVRKATINSAALWKTRLQNSELATLTSL